jgi:hypothetical protein
MLGNISHMVQIAVSVTFGQLSGSKTGLFSFLVFFIPLCIYTKDFSLFSFSFCLKDFL